MVNPENFRNVIGMKLREFREHCGLSAYRVAKDGGIRIDQVKIVEEGTTNYTMDVFLGYIRGCHLYIFFGEKSRAPGVPFDKDDMLESLIDNDPQL